MDSLYENLENYEDDNIINDLKNENKELKIKIDKYSFAINQLQKDFDKLSSEYRKLELNYSSLLKTAKDEIERKTQIITNLNTEKDMLVIKSLQTRRRGFFNSIKNIDDGSNTGSFKNTTENRQARSKSPARSDFKRDQQETNVEKCEDSGSLKSSKKDVKENISEEKYISKSTKIVNRRKSMPNVRFDEDGRTPVWSSEDENDQYTPLWKPRLSNIEYSDKRSNKILETSKVDDNYSYHSQTSQETRHKRRSSRRTDDNYKNTDKYESYHHRRRGSPERKTRTCTKRNKLANYGHNGRQKSPLSERYRHHKSRERRSNYERDHPHYNDIIPPNEKYAMKHKILPHLEEPSHKKIRIDSYGEYLIGDQGVAQREHVHPSKALISPDHPYRSCQSPDHFPAEYNDQYSIKEIRHTASIPLEDPRISSKKYLMKTENNKAILQTVSSHNIDIKMVDKSIWGLPKIIVPNALLGRPSPTRMSEDLVDEIYMNIDRLEFDMSLESGEIGRIDDETLVTTRTDSNTSNDKTKTENIEEVFNDKQVRDKHLLRDPSEGSWEKSRKLPINQYKIPKLNKQSSEVRNNENSKDKVLLTENCSIQKKELQPTVLPNIMSVNAQTDNELCLPMITDSKSNSTEHTKMIDNDQENQVCSLGTVEGDLLLSDDGSDNMELTKQNRVVEHINERSEHKFIQENNTHEITTVGGGTCEELKNKADHSRQESEVEKSNKSKKDCSSTSKSKKKQETKPKEQNKDTDTKRSKSKKVKEAKVDEIKTKFGDLFGEGSSLIMPEDLGIDTTVATTGKQNQFVSVFDDTQSAVDLQIEQKDKMDKALEDDKNVETDRETNNMDVKCLKNDFTTNNTLIIAKKSNDNPENELAHTTEPNNDKLNLYVNCNPEVSLDGSDVVIISVGGQPNYTEAKLFNCDRDTEIDENLPSKNYSLPDLNALATSTPLKIGIDTIKCTHAQNVAAQESNNNVDSSTNSNTKEQVNEPDVPDVRIFVKRRRKVKKL